jgi:protein tyrosine phosphatase (PTP) superfamily phosphohydrolase (DUF442 family)
MDISEARNFRRVSDRLLTCGQPTEAQLGSAREQGIQVVVNLALHDNPRYSLRDERGTVESLGMTYVHIPVQFDAPTEEDLLAFFAALDAHCERALLVHCGANYRVSAFLGLYNAIRLGRPRGEAFALMDSVWAPDAVWAQFIENMLSKHGDKDAKTKNATLKAHKAQLQTQHAKRRSKDKRHSL